MEQYPILDLDVETARTLDVLVAGFATAVVAVLSDAELDGPIASIRFKNPDHPCAWWG